MTFRAVILCNPGQDVGNIDVTFYADSLSAAEVFVERMLDQLGLVAGYSLARID